MENYDQDQDQPDNQSNIESNQKPITKNAIAREDENNFSDSEKGKRKIIFKTNKKFRYNIKKKSTKFSYLQKL